MDATRDVLSAALLRGTLQSGLVGDAAVRDAEGPALADGRLFEDRALAELATEYALFSHAVLFARLGRDFATQDPVAEFVRERGLGGRVGFHDFDRPLFSGLAARDADEAWDRRIFVCPRDAWDARDAEGRPYGLAWRLGGVAVRDRRAGAYHRLLPQAVQVIDPVAERRAGLRAPIQTATVTVYVACGTHLDVAMTQGTYPILPRLVPAPSTPARRAERHRVLLEAHRLAAGDPDPFRTDPPPVPETRR